MKLLEIFMFRCVRWTADWQPVAVAPPRWRATWPLVAWWNDGREQKSKVIVGGLMAHMRSPWSEVRLHMLRAGNLQGMVHENLLIVGAKFPRPNLVLCCGDQQHNNKVFFLFVLIFVRTATKAHLGHCVVLGSLFGGQQLRKKIHFVEGGGRCCNWNLFSQSWWELCLCIVAYPRTTHKCIS